MIRRPADADTARRFPLPVDGPADWRMGGGRVQLSFDLGELGAGTLLVPSLALAEAGPGNPPPPYHWTLACTAGHWALPRVPATAPGEPPQAQRPGATVSTHIDCFRIHRRLEAARLIVDIESAEPPQRYLVTASSRPFTVADPPLPNTRAALPRPPPERSQMAAPAAIAPRICSPTCVSMVLGLWRAEHDWLTLCEECFDPATNMYGVWPLALAAAARRGVLGSVEVFTDWQAPLEALRRGVPLVTSVRFGTGELPDAPLTETSGHLVVVHGAGPDGVDVCDPAAEDGTVARRYPADAFSRAWLRHRGAAYILPA